MRKAHLLASAVFAAAVFVASPGPASAGQVDGFQVTYGGVFDEWLTITETNEAALHVRIGPVPANLVERFSLGTELNGTGAGESYNFNPPYGIIAGASDFFAAKIDVNDRTGRSPSSRSA